MKHSFLKVMIYCNLVLLCGLLRSGGYTYADQSSQDKGELQNTIQMQNETIKQLQAEIKKLQDTIDQATAKKAPLHPVAKAINDSRVGCAKRQVEVVKDGLVQISFRDVHDVTYFFDTGSEEHARHDLAVFLKTAKLDKGTIEYYSDGRKLFSITGSLTSAKTKKHY